MYPNWWVFLGFGILGIWLGVVTYLLWQVRSFLQSLFPSDGGDFRKKLEEVFREVRFVREFREMNLKNFNRVSLKRFNPYQDTGGDQSFTLSLLNDNHDGFVITSLHARAGTRVFAKEIKDSKSLDVKLSDEEEQVIKEALKL